MSGGGGSFESRRLKASGESSGCCKKGNLLLFVLVGFIVFYVGVGIHMYLGPHLSAVSQDGQSNAIAMAASAPASPTSLEAQLRGGREGDPGALGSAENPSTGTVAADGIDDAVTAVVSCSTTQGDLTIDVRGNWAPIGSQQFLSLVEKGLFTDLPFFRVCPRYISKI